MQNGILQADLSRYVKDAKNGVEEVAHAKNSIYHYEQKVFTLENKLLES